MDRAKALDRVVKLLASATSSNEHEAENARRRAEELRASHGISQEEIDEYVDASEQVYEDAGVLGDDFWQVRIALAIADRVGCHAMKKENRLIFRGSPRRVSKALLSYTPIARDVENGCESVYLSWGHPPIFRPVLKPILLEEAARAVAERVLGGGQPARFPVSAELQREIFAWSRGATGSPHCAQMHMGWARNDGRAIGLAVNIGVLDRLTASMTVG